MLIFHCCWDGESYGPLKLYRELVNMKALRSWKCVVVIALHWHMASAAQGSQIRSKVWSWLFFVFVRVCQSQGNAYDKRCILLVPLNIGRVKQGPTCH